MFTHANADIQREVRTRLAYGCELLTLAEIIRRVDALGYRLDRSMDCACVARTMTGPDAGTSYPTITACPREKDTGLSFANCDARRDANYKALQAMRLGGVFAIVRGHIFDI